MAAALKFPDQGPRKRWLNHIPQWIVETEEYVSLTAGCKQTLQAIANACDAPTQPDGDLTVAFGGKALAQAAGVSIRSLFTHIKTLERLGFIVTLGRGGVVGARNVSNLYGIPGAPGNMSDRSRRREMRTMVKGEDGVYRPQVIQPGDQATLWPKKELEPEVVHRKLTAKAPRWEGGRANFARGSCKNCTPPSPYPSPYEKKHAPKVSKRRGKFGRIRNIEPVELRDDAKLLALYRELVREGVVRDCEADLLFVFGAAVHALRRADNPCAMFVSMVRNNENERIYVTNGDDEEARYRVRRVRGEQRASDGACEPIPSPRHSEAIELSEDAVFVCAAIKAGHARGIRTHDALVRQLHAEDRTWTRERWDKAIRELEQARVERFG